MKSHFSHEYKILLVGSDIEQLYMRIHRPLEYWRAGRGRRILQLWLATRISLQALEKLARKRQRNPGAIFTVDEHGRLKWKNTGEDSVLPIYSLFEGSLHRAYSAWTNWQTYDTDSRIRLMSLPCWPQPGYAPLGWPIDYPWEEVLRVRICPDAHQGGHVVQRWNGTSECNPIAPGAVKVLQNLQGDMVRPDLGLTTTAKRQLKERVSIVINAAADISLKATLRDAVVRNCQSALELARLASDFPRLLAFVQVSSLFALSFLPDGPVREEMYPIPNAERAYHDILSGTNEDWESYAWPYARSKHLMECLLTQRYAKLPLILLRPSSIGPAIAQPFEMYGPTPSIPINNLYARLMAPNPGTSVFHATRGSNSGTNVLDEIPVDLVANVLLQHVQRGSRGPVHAGAHLYVPRHFDQVISDAKRYVPAQWRAKMTTVVFSTNFASQECQLAEFYRVSTRGWDFCVGRSALLDRTGPLGLQVPGHDGEMFTERRVKEFFQKVTSSDRGSSRL